jgi:MoaA/NifB/PqqE/SkfB family radical SAM enzyme
MNEVDPKTFEKGLLTPLLEASKKCPSDCQRCSGKAVKEKRECNASFCMRVAFVSVL